MNGEFTKTERLVETSAPGVTQFRPLRIWPAVILVVLMLATRFGPELFEGGRSTYWMVAAFGPLLCCLLILIWWLSASRATWKERVFGFIGIAASAAVVMVFLIHPSMRGPAITYLMVPMG